ncbi:MAG: hypothetical protein ACRD4R_01995 [Candidatus Acidiferrales bacterium]
MAHEERRRVEHSCIAGSQFAYYCDDCSLYLRGWDNKNYVASANGWTWELLRNEEEIDSAGNKFVRHYGGTEEAALRDGLKRFDEEPCVRPN